jgi:hypothetical protein
MMDEEGRVYAFDGGDCRIAVFDREGKYLRDIGRRGSGPGEFQSMRPLWLHDGQVAVYDSRQFRASVFSTEGRFLRSNTRAGASNRMAVAPVMRMLSSVVPLPDGRAIHLMQEQHNFGTEEQAMCTLAILVSADEDSQRAFTTDLWALPMVPSKLGGVTPVVTMFTNSPNLVVDVERGILMADPREPVAKWYGFDGRLNRELRLGLEPLPVTADEKNAIEDYWQNRIPELEGSSRDHFEEQWQNTTIPDKKNLWERVLVDDQGFLWFRYHVNWLLPEEERSLWAHMVFSPEGEYLGSVTWPGHLCSISRGHYIWRRLDEETDGYRYVVYRLRPAVEGLEYPG